MKVRGVGRRRSVECMVDSVRVMCPKCKVDVRQFFIREHVLDQIVVDLHCCRCLYQWSECWDVERLEELVRTRRYHQL
jgi:hypothetical protein